MKESQPKRTSSRRTVLTFTLGGGAALAAGMYGGRYLTMASPARAVEVTLYKNPECECCEGYAEYLRDNGFKVTVEATHNLPLMQRMAGVPDGLEGCHLSMIDGYAVAGHVPIATIEKLLGERPPIKGITLSGMPQGSPGMNGAKKETFVVYEIGGSDAGGEPKIYATE